MSSETWVPQSMTIVSIRMHHMYSQHLIHIGINLFLSLMFATTHFAIKVESV
jgi:hypothetical protein